MYLCTKQLLRKFSYETLLIRQKCKQYILKWDAVGSILKQSKFTKPGANPRRINMEY